VTCVVDASVAFKWFLSDEPLRSEALAVATNEGILTAPDQIIAEVCNAAWRAARLRRLAWQQVDEIAATLPNIFETLVVSRSLAPRAVFIARELDHPVYDCLYVALAEAHGLRLVSADARLLAKLHGTRWASLSMALSDYPVR
jgi:predicted nucleic acid-binding protein